MENEKRNAIESTIEIIFKSCWVLVVPLIPLAVIVVVVVVVVGGVGLQTS